MLVERLKKIGRAIRGDHASATSPESETTPDSVNERSRPAPKAAKRATARNSNPSLQKFRLNFRSVSEEDLSAMASATLHDGGYVEPERRSFRAPEVGDKMPDGTIYAGISPDTGKGMFAMPEDAPLTMTWKKAMKYAKDLDAHGHQDWRLPSKDELNVLFNNRAAIAEFHVTGLGPACWYWSASENGRWYAWSQRFSDGCENYDDGKDGRSSLRVVR